MMLPMLGLLFMLFVAGLLSAPVLYLVPGRRLAPFALVPIFGAVGAFVSCVGLSIGLEQLFASQRVGGLGFFGGYLLGGLLGASAGFRLARRLVRRQVPNHALQRTEAGDEPPSDLRA